MGPLYDDDESAVRWHRNKFSRWSQARDRMFDEVWPVPNPSFELSAGSTIFTIGSCFTRNIEECLQQQGFRIPMLQFGVPPEEWPWRPNGILNKYTPPGIFQEIDWAKKIYCRNGFVRDSDCDDFFFDCGSGLCIDTNLDGFGLVTYRRFYERRRQIYTVFRELFSSEFVVITLGLIEAWFDREKSIYIHRVPNGKHFANHRRRFAFEVLSYEKCRTYVQQAIDAVREINKEAKFIITVSPVPLESTFTADDVITANTQSKSVLRAVAGDIVSSNKNVDYFPAYETVVGTKSWRVWQEDLVHVSQAFVGQVVQRLTEFYCPWREGERK